MFIRPIVILLFQYSHLIHMAVKSLVWISNRFLFFSSVSNLLWFSIGICFIGVIHIGLLLPLCCSQHCLDTLWSWYPLLMFFLCLFTRLRKCCIVRPMYCFPHAQSSKYITYCVSHLKWDLMLNSSLVCVDFSFLSCANSLQHLRLFFPHLMVSCLSFCLMMLFYAAGCY